MLFYANFFHLKISSKIFFSAVCGNVRSIFLHGKVFLWTSWVRFKDIFRITRYFVGYITFSFFFIFMSIIRIQTTQNLPSILQLKHSEERWVKTFRWKWGNFHDKPKNSTLPSIFHIANHEEIATAYTKGFSILSRKENNIFCHRRENYCKGLGNLFAYLHINSILSSSREMENLSMWSFWG